MITIDQLLESVDLDFEPRWVTKDKDGTITIFKNKPQKGYDVWTFVGKEVYFILNKLKLSNFDGKDWTECIYEVPRKTTRKIERLEPLNGLQHNWLDKINEIIDWINDNNKDSK